MVAVAGVLKEAFIATRATWADPDPAFEKEIGAFWAEAAKNARQDAAAWRRFWTGFLRGVKLDGL